MNEYDYEEEKVMPFISMNTNAAMSKETILEMKRETGRILALIPGKDESQLMLQINESQNMFFKGEEVPCMMVQVNCYGHAEKEELEPFVRELTAAIEKIAGVPKTNVYLTIDGYDHWGASGHYI